MLPGALQSVVVGEGDAPADGYRVTGSSIETTSVAVTSLARLTAEITAAPSAAATIHHRSRSDVTVGWFMLIRDMSKPDTTPEIQEIRASGVCEADTLSRA